jgi:hypothetical protein
MPGRPQHKEVHLHLDPSLTNYWVATEYEAFHASTDEEEEQLKAVAYQQVDQAIKPYLAEGWVLDGAYDQSVGLERRIIKKEGSFLFGGHTHIAAIVGAKVRLRR